MSGALPGLPFRLWASPNVFPRAVQIICKLHAFVDAGVPIPCVLQYFVKVQAPIICKLQCFFNVQGSILCNLHVFLSVQASIICNLHAFVTLQQRIFRFPGSFLGYFCAFGVPWGLLDSLGELKSLQAIFLIDFSPIWSHFGGPGADFGGPGLHFGGPGAPFWMP